MKKCSKMVFLDNNEKISDLPIYHCDLKLTRNFNLKSKETRFLQKAPFQNKSFQNKNCNYLWTIYSTELNSQLAARNDTALQLCILHCTGCITIVLRTKS